MPFQGMIVEDVRAQAEQTRTAQQTLTERAEELGSRIASIDAWWRGPDAEQFALQWHTEVMPRLGDALQRMGQLAQDLETEADQQEETSSGGGGTGGGANGGPGMGRTVMDGPGDTPMDEDVRNAWTAMSPEQQRAVLQQMVDEEFERYGMDPVAIQYFYEEPDADGMVTFGSWTEEEKKLQLNEYLLSDPELALTTVHEVRHAAQSEMVRRTEPGFWDFLPFVDSREDDYERIEQDYRITRDEIEAWRENNEEGNYITPEEDFEEYQAQPVEYDAREREDEYAGSLTFEELQRLQREAGVPESEKPR